MRTRTRSRTPCASPSRHYANASANPGSSPPCPASATASTRNQTPRMREESVDRAPGLSVRLKLTLSYAGFLMLAGAVLLAAGYFSLSRGVHPGVVFLVDSHAALLRYFAPIAAIVMAFLLVFGLAGGWMLAGRMLAPLARITDATRMAGNGSLAHRIELEGRQDEFRELADSFDAMLARLEAHVAEQQRFAANASHELRTPLAITQTLLDAARNDPQPGRTGHRVGHDQRSPEERRPPRREPRRQARPTAPSPASRAISARHQTHTHRPRGRRSRPRNREKHHPSTRRDPHPHPRP